MDNEEIKNVLTGYTQALIENFVKELMEDELEGRVSYAWRRPNNPDEKINHFELINQFKAFVAEQ